MRRVIRLTESDLHSIIENAARNYMLTEDGEDGGAFGGGATSCSLAGGDSVGQYTTPLGRNIYQPIGRNIYQPTYKRSKDFSNGSMAMQKAEDESTDVVNKKKKK